MNNINIKKVKWSIVLESNAFQISPPILCVPKLNFLLFDLFRDLGEVMDFELDVECSVDPEPEASGSKSSSSSSFPEVCVKLSQWKIADCVLVVYSR